MEWTDSLKETQRNWIGRSEGTEVQFKIKDSDKEFTIFTTRADTMFGVTFMVLAPESEWVPEVTTEAQKAEVEAYLDATKKRTERERIADRRVTGVFSGSYAVNPFTGEKDVYKRQVTWMGCRLPSSSAPMMRYPGWLLHGKSFAKAQIACPNLSVLVVEMVRSTLSFSKSPNKPRI